MLYGFRYRFFRADAYFGGRAFLLLHLALIVAKVIGEGRFAKFDTISLGIRQIRHSAK